MDTSTTKITIDTPVYDHNCTGEYEMFCESVVGVDSWLSLEMLEMDVRTLLGLPMADSNSVRSCLETMSLSSIADTESARGFGASIAILSALLEEVRGLPLRSSIDLGDIIGSSTAAAVPATAVVLSVSTLTLFLVFFGPRLFLGMFRRAIARMSDRE